MNRETKVGKGVRSQKGESFELILSIREDDNPISQMI